LKQLLERLKSSWPGRFGTAYGQSKAGNYAAGLAFNAFMTMFPLILGLLSIVGLLIQDPGTEARVRDVIVGVFPSGAHGELVQAFQGVKRNVGLLGIISIGGLIWGGTSFFVSMEFALTQIYGTQQRTLFRQRLMGVVMMLLFLAALLLAAGANSAAGTPLPIGRVAGFVVGALVLVGLLIAIYRFVPNRSFRLTEIWPGALVAGVLIEVLSLLFPIYANLAHGFNTYGQQFGLFFLLATWLYLLSQLLLLGAVFNRMRLGPPREEGMVAQPGDRGEPPPAPAEAIEAQREEEGAEVGAGDSRQPVARSDAARTSDAGRTPRDRGPSRQPSGRGTTRPQASSASRPQSRTKAALWSAAGTLIGLAALARRPKTGGQSARR
jgi:membrane protein